MRGPVRAAAAAATAGLLLGCPSEGPMRKERAARTEAPGPTAEPVPQASSEVWEGLRRHMVTTQLGSRDIVDPEVLRVMGRVPRHLFVPEDDRSQAYADRPLPIGFGQTISQPYIVAYMTQALEPEPGDRVLEIGTGSGYQAAVLAELTAQVYTIEIVPELARRAQRTLEELGYTNTHVRAGDGYFGWPEEAPFDGIMVTAAPDHVPQALVEQLAPGAHLVLPVGDLYQELIRITKQADGTTLERLLPVRFVPMTGRAEER